MIAFLLLVSIFNLGILIALIHRDSVNRQREARMLSQFYSLMSKYDKICVDSDTQKMVDEFDAYFRNLATDLAEFKEKNHSALSETNTNCNL